MSTTCGHGSLYFFFFQAEDGIRDLTVTGVQTCALPIWVGAWRTTPLPFSIILESRESSRTSRKARDRAERREVPVRRDAECVDRLGAGGLQYVQVAAVVAQRDVVGARAGQGGPPGGLHHPDAAV